MMAKVRVTALILVRLPGNLSSEFVTGQRNLSFGRSNIIDLKEDNSLFEVLRTFLIDYKYVNSLVSNRPPEVLAISYLESLFLTAHALGVGDQTHRQTAENRGFRCACVQIKNCIRTCIEKEQPL